MLTISRHCPPFDRYHIMNNIIQVYELLTETGIQFHHTAYRTDLRVSAIFKRTQTKVRAEFRTEYRANTK